MTYTEKQLYMNIIYCLSSNKEDVKSGYYDKIQNLTKNVYSERLRDVENKENEISILKFLVLKDDRFKMMFLYFSKQIWSKKYF